MAIPEGTPLGPRRKWKEERSRWNKPLHRHLPWLVPTGACGAFVILIVGAIGVRTVILRRTAAETEIPAGNSESQQTSVSSDRSSHDPLR